MKRPNINRLIQSGIDPDEAEAILEEYDERSLLKEREHDQSGETLRFTPASPRRAYPRPRVIDLRVTRTVGEE
jgi:hypothetical protein